MSWKEREKQKIKNRKTVRARYTPFNKVISSSFLIATECIVISFTMPDKASLCVCRPTEIDGDGAASGAAADGAASGAAIDTADDGGGADETKEKKGIQ